MPRCDTQAIYEINRCETYASQAHFATLSGRVNLRRQPGKVLQSRSGRFSISFVSRKASFHSVWPSFTTLDFCAFDFCASFTGFPFAVFRSCLETILVATLGFSEASSNFTDEVFWASGIIFLNPISSDFIWDKFCCWTIWSKPFPISRVGLFWGFHAPKTDPVSCELWGLGLRDIPPSKSIWASSSVEWLFARFSACLLSSAFRKQAYMNCHT